MYFLHVHALILHIIMPKVNANIIYGIHILIQQKTALFLRT